MSGKRRHATLRSTKWKYSLTFVGVWIVATILILSLLSPGGPPSEVRISDLIPPKYNGLKLRIVRATVFLTEGTIPGFIREQIQLPRTYLYTFAATDSFEHGTILQCFSTRLYGLKIDQVITILGTLYYRGPAGPPYILVDDIE